MSPADARAAAHRKLGNPARIRETIYEMNSILLVDALWRDLRFSLQRLRKRPGFTVVVVLSLALGIGANTAIFSLVDGIIFRPLPVPDAGGLVTVDIAASRLTSFGGSSYLDWVDLSTRSKSFQALSTRQEMAAGMNPAGAIRDGKPEVVYGELVSGNFFSTLGVQPALGRTFLPEEDQTPGEHPVIVISYSLWKRTFAANPEIIGKQVELSGHSFTIIGVTPPVVCRSVPLVSPRRLSPNDDDGSCRAGRQRHTHPPELPRMHAARPPEAWSYDRAGPSRVEPDHG